MLGAGLPLPLPLAEGALGCCGMTVSAAAWGL